MDVADDDTLTPAPPAGIETSGEAAAAWPVGLRRRRVRVLRWVTASVAVAVPVPFLFLFVLGTGLGRNPRLVRSPLLGKPAPQFSLPRFDQPGTISSGDLVGRISVRRGSGQYPGRRRSPLPSERPLPQ